jgi:hypothetical protein
VRAAEAQRRTSTYTSAVTAKGGIVAIVAAMALIVVARLYATDVTWKEETNGLG